MRGDQPARDAASPTISPSIGPKVNITMSGCGSALAAVAVLEADHVVEVRRRDLEDRRVLERGDAVDGSGGVVERRARGDDLGVQRPLPHLAQLELGPPG